MLSFRIAFRFLKSGKTQTILIIAGIAIAISIQIFVGLLINSLQKSLLDRTIGGSPHITITSTSDVATIRSWEGILSRLRQTGYFNDVSASASASGFTQKKDKEVPVLMRGFNLDNADGIYHISDSIYQGRSFRSSSEVLIGKELSQDLELGVGDKLNVITPAGKSYDFTISGIYDLGVASINKTWIISNMKTVQQMFELSNRVTSIEMTVSDPFSADIIAAQIGQLLKENDLKIDNWKDQNRDLLRGLEGQKNSSTIIQVVIVVSVIIAIASVLVISVLQKSRQIGILKAMGIKDFAASLIFIYQGFLLGLIGSVAGVLLGLGLLFAFYYFTTSPDGTTLIDLYIEYDFIIRSWLIALLAATIAGLIPARKSLRLNPIEVIREG